jgi:UDPglucose 6-dehydrogenase
MIKKLLNKPVIFDGRNLYDIGDMNAENIRYVSIGRKEVN